MDKEERMRKLAELRAQREAKQKETAAITQNPPAASSAAVSLGPAVAPKPNEQLITSHHDGSTSNAASPPRHDSSGQGGQHSSPSFNRIERNVGAVDVVPEIPEPIPMYDHAVETEHVYIYSEPRQNPDDVVSKADVELMIQDRLAKRAIDDSSREDLSGSFNSTVLHATMTARTTALQAIGSTRPLWDKTSSSGAKKMVQSPAFISFFSRGVSATADALRRGSLSSDNLLASLQGDAAADRAVAKLIRRGRYYDDRTCHDAVITAISFQPHSSDVFAAAVVSGTTSQAEDGDARTVVLLWYVRKASEPLRFVSAGTGAARALTWSKFHEHLLIAGTDRGRIVLWNTCTQGHPIATSFPSPDSHNQAVLRVGVQGDGNSNALVSVGCDGKICTWPVDKPRRPLAVRDAEGGHGCFASAAALCDETREDGAMAFAARVLFGGHDGSALYAAAKSAQRLDLKRRSTGDTKHDAMVTCVDAHPAHSDRRIQELVLTSSLDRSCRIWPEDGSHAPPVVIEGFPDYVYDVKWSPVVPSVFACADGTGTVYLFNLLTHATKPVARVSLQQAPQSEQQPPVISLGPGSTGAAAASAGASVEAGGGGGRAVSVLSLQWDDSGQHLLCGTSGGDVVMLDVVLPPVPAETVSKQLSEWVSTTFNSEP